VDDAPELGSESLRQFLRQIGHFCLASQIYRAAELLHVSTIAQSRVKSDPKGPFPLSACRWKGEGGKEYNPRFYFPSRVRYLSPLPFLRPTHPTSWVGSVSVEITK